MVYTVGFNTAVGLTVSEKSDGETAEKTTPVESVSAEKKCVEQEEEQRLPEIQLDR